VCVYHILLFHLLIEYLRIVPHFRSFNNASMKIHVQVFVWTDVFTHLDRYLGMEFLGLMLNALYLIFWDNFKLFNMDVPFYISIRELQGIQSIQILLTLHFLSPLVLLPSYWYKVIFHCSFGLNFPNDQWC
jgi:hypothetical protein